MSNVVDKKTGQVIPVPLAFKDEKSMIGSKNVKAWYNYLSTPQVNMAKNALETAKRIAEFKAVCEAEKKPFLQAVKTWFDMDKDAASEWGIIGENLDRIMVLEILPPGRRALAKIARMDEQCLLEFNQADVSKVPYGQGKIETFVSDYNNRLKAPQAKLEGSVFDTPEPEPKPKPETEDSPEQEKVPPSEASKLESEYNDALENMAGLFVEYPEIPAMLQSYFHPDKPTGNTKISQELNSIIPAIRRYLRKFANVA